ncbi:unnamed protein product, partial [Haemonchus placei]|uniref:NAD(P)-bd_dom domain-containing protein n=1 Tax=Haemonchus placei TaxID=6290 RepID=A0A0N4VTI8_HAEPC
MLEKRIDSGLLSAVCSQLLEECTPSKLVFLSSQIFGGANC